MALCEDGLRVCIVGKVSEDGDGHQVGPDVHGHSVGARGMAQAIYFDDPDGHALEIRVYPERADIA